VSLSHEQKKKGKVPVIMLRVLLILALLGQAILFLSINHKINLAAEE
jgi:flagellar basal body-associated protein FliL